METQYDYAVFIGRFQPFHRGHYHVATEALKKASKLIFVIGSHDAPRTPKNPFTTVERREIILSAFDDEQRKRIKMIQQTDHTYNEERWISSIQTSVLNTCLNDNEWSPDPIKIALVGYSKDHSSYYLKKFPQWDLIEIEPIYKNLSATCVRNVLLFDPKELLDQYSYFMVSEQHANFVLSAWAPIQEQMKAEWKVICDYKGAWSNAPYAPSFNTVDCVVTQSGHILLVKRRAAPGKGLWALPGGFVNPTETLREAALRELLEETKIKVPLPVLNGCIIGEKTYDAPDRSLRGRTITQCFRIKLNDMETLPKIKGSDDAEKAIWMPFAEFSTMRNHMFEDHYCIVEDQLGI